MIETGLLVGTDPANLVSIGQPVYGSRPQYRREITVGQTREYWIVAYAVDEDGAIIHSPKRVVFVAVPPPGLLPHGSHGAPPFYTGTDEDFLRQAGDPHFASMRRLDMDVFTLLKEEPFGAFHPFYGGTSHWVGSVNRGEVSDGQGSSLVLGDGTFSVPSGDVQGVFDTIDGHFAAFAFPRPGFSVVTCGVGAEQGVYSPVVCETDARTWRTDFGGIGLSYREGLSQEFTIFRQFEGVLRNRASVTYFIPRAEPGQQLLSARLVARMLVFTSDLTQALLGGKTPIDVPASCAGSAFCSGMAAWDFTAEAAALASAGGGQLTMQIGPVPPGVDVTDTSFGFYRQLDALFNILLDVDYPWSHGGQIGGFTLVFRQTCPKQLTVTASPTAVRPQIPPSAATTLPNATAVVPTTSTIDVFVQTCPPGGASPPTVDVALEVQAPSPGTPEAAGHLHDSRPASAKGTLKQAAAIATGCTALIDGQGMGRCTLTYEASVVSGVETIVATAPDFAEARATVRVAVPDLADLGAIQTNFFRLTGQIAGRHTDNHSGTSTTLDNVQRLALDFFAILDGVLHINDMSLPWGGLFDINGNWAPSHVWHRTGLSVDIESMACLDPGVTGACTQTIPVPKPFIARLCAQYGNGFLAPETSIHCEYRQP